LGDEEGAGGIEVDGEGVRDLAGGDAGQELLIQGEALGGRHGTRAAGDLAVELAEYLAGRAGGFPAHRLLRVRDDGGWRVCELALAEGVQARALELDAEVLDHGAPGARTPRGFHGEHAQGARPLLDRRVRVEEGGTARRDLRAHPPAEGPGAD